jgi:hypothetical protein
MAMLNNQRVYKAIRGHAGDLPEMRLQNPAVKIWHVNVCCTVPSLLFIGITGLSPTASQCQEHT